MHPLLSIEVGASRLCTLNTVVLHYCCDGAAATTELRRPAPSRSFCASRLAE